MRPSSRPGLYGAAGVGTAPEKSYAGRKAKGHGTAATKAGPAPDRRDASRPAATAFGEGPGSLATQGRKLEGGAARRFRSEAPPSTLGKGHLPAAGDRIWIHLPFLRYCSPASGQSKLDR